MRGGMKGNASKNNPVGLYLQQCRSDLFGRALRLTRDPSHADDLVQETLAKAWQHRERLQGPVHARAWSRRTLRNEFVDDYWRAQRTETSQERAEKASQARQTEQDGGGAAGAPLELRAALRDAMTRLPSEARDVIVLVDVQGLTYQEAANALGCPLGTVMSRLHRARAQVRRQLDDPGALPVALASTP